MTNRWSLTMYCFIVIAVAVSATAQTLTPVPVSTVVFDSTGKKVGMTMFDDGDLLFRKDDGTIVSLKFNHNGGWITKDVLFESADCSGRGFVQTDTGTLVDGRNVLYNPNPGSMELVEIYSRLSAGSDTCSPVPGVVFGVLRGPFSRYVDLDTLFTPPFTRSVIPTVAVPSFSDVPSTHPFFQYIEMFRAAGITSGCAAGQFCPDAFVTRGQMAVFLSRVLGLRYGFN